LAKKFNGEGFECGSYFLFIIPVYHGTDEMNGAVGIGLLSEYG